MSKYQHFIGIDAGRYKNQIVRINGQGQKMDALQFNNDHRGCEQLMHYLSQRSTRHTVIGIEGHGVCSNLVLNRLAKAQYPIKSIMPISIKRHKDYFTQPIKNDGYDALVTADYLRLRHRNLQDFDVQRCSNILALKELSKLYKDYTKRQTAYVNQLHQAIMNIFPEYIISETFSKLHCVSSLTLLSQWPTPQNIVAVSFTEFYSLIAKSSHGRISRIQTLKIRRLAKSAIHKSLDYNAPGLTISSLAKMLLLLREELKRIKKLIEAYLFQLPEAKILLSLDGVGSILSARFLSAIGSIDRFANNNALALYTGVTCLDFKSGKTNRTRRAYRVNHMAKDTMMQIANASKRFNPQSKAYFERKIKEGKSYWQAVKALARHLIRIIFVLLKNNKTFQRTSGN